MNAENLILSTSSCDVTLSDTEVLELYKMTKRKNDIEKMYSKKIKKRKDDDRYYIYISRKQYIAPSYDELIQILYELFYGIYNASFEDLFPDWLKWKRDYSSTSSKTLKEYSSVWNNLLKEDSLMQTPIVKIKNSDYLNLFRKLTRNRTMTKKAFGNLKSLLNGILKYAIELEIIEYNPLSSIDYRQFTFKPVNHSNDVFTIEEREVLLAHIREINSMYALAIQLDFHLVARIGELLAIRWNDIEGDYIHIQGQCVRQTKMNDDLSFSPRTFENVNHVKGYSDEGFRYLPITSECRKILDRIREFNPDGEFVLMQNNKQLLSDTFNEYLRKYCIEIGIKPRSSHKIRFTVASILYNKGVPLQVLKKY